MKATHPIHTVLWLMGLTVLAAAILFLTYRYDNKYTYTAYTTDNGVVHMDVDWSNPSAMFFPTSGWELYRGRYLSPDMLAHVKPDDYVNLDHAMGAGYRDEDDPYYESTYRLTIPLDATERDYALWLPEVYLSYRAWVNGAPAFAGEGGSDGFEGPTGTFPMVTFRAKDSVEIVLAVSEYMDTSSGGVIPCLGRPSAVYRYLTVRSLVRITMNLVSLFIAGAYLIMGRRYRPIREAVLFAGICICFVGATAYPILNALGLRGKEWYVLERLCSHCMYPLIAILAGLLCSAPKRLANGVALFAATAYLADLVVVIAAPDLGRQVYLLYIYLRLSIWVTAIYLLLAGIHALRQGGRHALMMTGTFCIFICVLVFEAIYPVYEPIITGWRLELAGIALIVLVGSILIQDTITVLLDSRALKEKGKLTEAQLDLHREHYHLQREYIRRTGKYLHENRSRILIAQKYLDNKEYKELDAYLKGLLQIDTHGKPVEYCENELVNIVLSYVTRKAEELDVEFHFKIDGLPAAIPIADKDLTSVLLNVVENALEACRSQPNGVRRWISLILKDEQGVFSVFCSNSKSNPIETHGLPATSKADKMVHGYGLKIIQETAALYDGIMDVDHDDVSFQIRVAMSHLEQPVAPSEEVTA
ncbi:GHKL domain-containing protein, partial [Ruminococcaceae bacterium OttesenSCG-928-L11]|nr:GHKL domain-containing protein [Ruminococcaceae bacterium OttesenSCG-928-L11]